MIRLRFICLIAICTLLTSCFNENLYDPNLDENKANDFDFVTSVHPQLTLDYKRPVAALFYIYAENPMKVNAVGQDVLKSELKPVFTGYTNEAGLYKGEIYLESSLKEAYVYSPSIGADQLIKANISGNTISAEASYQMPTKKNKGALKSRTSTRTTYSSGGFLTLGEWDEIGFPLYFFDDTHVDLKPDFTTILNQINAAFNDGRTVNKAYFKKSTIDVVKSTNIDLYFVHENAQKKNTILYYCYNTATEQNLTREEILKRSIIAFPSVDNWFDFDNEGSGLFMNEGFALHYFENGVDKGTQFPAGVSVGWILLSDGFVAPNVVTDNKEFFFSNPKLNPEAVRNSYEANHVAVFKNSDYVFLGFEDTTNEYTQGDGDCNDVVLAVKSYPIDAITSGIPDVMPRDKKALAYTIDYKGTLCFEDNWPSKGDYDMNDVVVKYHSVVSYTYENKVLGSEDEFKVIWSGALFRNSFGYDLGVFSSLCTVSLVEADYNPNFVKSVNGTTYKTMLLCDDARSATSNNTKTASYRLKTVFNNPTSYSFYIPPYNPFILIKGEVELHLPLNRPSGVKLHPELFGTKDDASSSSSYYRGKGNYPFAINIVGDNDLLFTKPGHEGPANPISVSYPRFIDWVKSYGYKNSDWYKFPKQ